MKLPLEKKTSSTQKGFTLIELMVVVSIIAFLSVIGIAAFSNAQKAARDGRRRADTDAIAKAYESNFNPIAGAYLTLTGSMFASGNIPSDPGSGSYATTLYPSGCTGTATSPVCKAFSVCATTMETNQGNSAGVTFTAGTPDTLTLNNGTSQYCRISQQSI